MRVATCNALIELSARADFMFLTGDVGFMALEPLREVAGARFVNAGVAEQNMISVAAGMSAVGLKPFVYTIAPFCYARPFEQIRNDVCLHNLPVRLIGNGGGFGYGPMGGTHHAIEDYGVLSALPNMRCFIPAFDEDVSAALKTMAALPGPSYLRLGRTEKPESLSISNYSSWRRLTGSSDVVIIVVGPIVGSYLADPYLSQNCEIWSLTELPQTTLPAELVSSLKKASKVIVAEEHVRVGSLGEWLSSHCLSNNISVKSYHHACVKGYLSGLYGSQKFHRVENGIDSNAIATIVKGG